MSRWTAVVGVGLLAAAIAILLIRPAVAPTDAERADALASGLRCPDCAGLSVADSHTASAVAIRDQIDELVASGATDAEIREHFTDRYGDWILLAPSAALTWILPFAVVVAAAAGLATWVWRRRTDASPSQPGLDEAERRRLHDEARAIDG
jgi:cytochrome c-type biogenesis protein CcmH